MKGEIFYILIFLESLIKLRSRTATVNGIIRKLMIFINIPPIFTEDIIPRGII